MRPKPVDKTAPNQACSEPQMAIRNIGNKIGLVSCRVKKLKCKKNKKNSIHLCCFVVDMQIWDLE